MNKGWKYTHERRARIILFLHTLHILFESNFPGTQDDIFDDGSYHQKNDIFDNGSYHQKLTLGEKNYE